MLGKIQGIVDNNVVIKLDIDINQQPNLIGLHIIFEDGTDRKVVAEIVNTDQTTMNATIIGEIRNNQFNLGSTAKPSFKSIIRIIRTDELELLYGKQQLLHSLQCFLI